MIDVDCPVCGWAFRASYECDKPEPACGYAGSFSVDLPRHCPHCAVVLTPYQDAIDRAAWRALEEADREAAS